MSKETYIKKMVPWAKKAEQETGLPYDFIVAQWGWETAWGTNRGAKELNNHAGIKYSKYSPAGVTQSGMYAKYPTMDHFIKDYARVMRLSYYKGIHSARTDSQRIVELNKSPYSEADYNVNTMLSAQKIAKTYGGGTVTPGPAPGETSGPAPGSGSAGGGGTGWGNQTDNNYIKDRVKTLDGVELEQFAMVGLALTIGLSLIPKK